MTVQEVGHTVLFDDQARRKRAEDAEILRLSTFLNAGVDPNCTLYAVAALQNICADEGYARDAVETGLTRQLERLLAVAKRHKDISAVDELLYYFCAGALTNIADFQPKSEESEPPPKSKSWRLASLVTRAAGPKKLALPMT